MNQNTSISHLPLMPLDPAWIEQAAAFHHPDPRMVKGLLKLLIASWRGSPAASIPASHSFIAECTGLPAEVVAASYVTLTEGFVIHDDGRLHHVHLAQICARMMEVNGKEIDAYAVASAMAMQDPEQFSLMSMEATSKRPRGKTLIPKGFGYDYEPAKAGVVSLREWASTHGFPAPNQQQWIMEKFIDYCLGRGEKQKDFPAAFRNWAQNELGYRRFPPEPLWPEGHVDAVQPSLAGFSSPAKPSPFAGLALRNAPKVFPSRGEQAVDTNMSLMAEAQHRAALRQRGGA